MFFPTGQRPQPQQAIIKPKVDMNQLMQINAQRKMASERAGILQGQLELDAAKLQEQTAARQQQGLLAQQGLQADQQQQGVQNQLAQHGMDIDQQRLQMDQQAQQAEMMEREKAQKMQGLMQQALKDGNRDKYMELLGAHDPRAASQIEKDMVQQERIIGQIAGENQDRKLEMIKAAAAINASFAKIPEAEREQYYTDNADVFIEAGVSGVPNNNQIAASTVLGETSGAQSSMEKSTKAFIEKEIFNDAKKVNTVNDLVSKYKPEYFTIEGRATNIGKEFLATLGLASEGDKIEIADRKQYMSAAEQVFLAYKKEITGAQASVQEIEMLRKAILDPDTFIPEKFFAQLEYMQFNLNSQLAIKREMLQNGINPYSVDGQAFMEKRTSERSEEQEDLRARALGVPRPNRDTPKAAEGNTAAEDSKYGTFGQFVPGAQ